MARDNLRHLVRDVHRIKEESVERVPRHFTMKSFVAATFGALFFGLTFALKGLLLQVTQQFPVYHKWYIMFAILVILSAEIYSIGYSHVKNKEKRGFGQFWFKRIVTYAVVGFFVSVFLVYVYALNQLVVSPEHLINTIVALALPCCIGASIADLLKQY
jgi:uncharacterized membrane protein